MKQDVIDKLCKDFKVNAEMCEMFERFYNSRFEEKLKVRFLSHLVATIEDTINDIYKERYIVPVLQSGQYTEEQKRAIIRRNYRLYSITLRSIPGFSRKGLVTHHNYGSIIVYNPDVMNETQVRVLIAHELGHIINLYVLNCDDTQNKANLFSFVAINGKDQFYKTKAGAFMYPSEFAIIDEISAVCPITKHEQKNE